MLVEEDGGGDYGNWRWALGGRGDAWLSVCGGCGTDAEDRLKAHQVNPGQRERICRWRSHSQWSDTLDEAIHSRAGRAGIGLKGRWFRRSVGSPRSGPRAALM